VTIFLVLVFLVFFAVVALRLDVFAGATELAFFLASAIGLRKPP
jgi:hypothetical protein